MNSSRRGFLLSSAGFLSLAAEAESMAGPAPTGTAQADQAAPGVFFHEGTLSYTVDAVCNNGWIIFDDYVLVIDANVPAGAKLIIQKIRALTDKPIRFVFDTHHHGDHAYGNQVMADAGAIAVAHTGVIDELKKFEPGAWEEAAKTRADVKASKLKFPSLLFSKDLIFDDGKHRVELMHLGVAHTHGDAVAWLPKEKILFTGDLCVNGPYNYTGDGDTGQWIKALDAAKKLGAEIVCPGHGPRVGGTVLDDQQMFFRALREQVGALVAKGAAGKARIEEVRAALKSNAQIARFVSAPGAVWDPLPSQVEKVYEELTGKKLAQLRREPLLARHVHARSHGATPA